MLYKVKGTRIECFNVSYTPSGEHLLCVDQDDKTLMLVDGKGDVTHQLKGHTDDINNISTIPNSNNVITAGEDGSYLFNLPTSSEQQNHNDDDVKDRVLACTLLHNSNEMILLKQYDEGKGVIEHICGDTFKSILRSDNVGEVNEYSNVIAHPTDDNLVVVSTLHNVLFVDTTTLRTVGMIESKYISEVTMCGDGTKCVVRTGSTCVVYDIRNIESIVTITTWKMEGWMISSDIHNDGSKVVCGGWRGVVLYDISTSEPTTTLCEGETYFVRFTYENMGTSMCTIRSLVSW